MYGDGDGGSQAVGDGGPLGDARPPPAVAGPGHDDLDPVSPEDVSYTLGQVEVVGRFRVPVVCGRAGGVAGLLQGDRVDGRIDLRRVGGVAAVVAGVDDHEPSRQRSGGRCRGRRRPGGFRRRRDGRGRHAGRRDRRRGGLGGQGGGTSGRAPPRALAAARCQDGHRQAEAQERRCNPPTRGVGGVKASCHAPGLRADGLRFAPWRASRAASARFGAFRLHASVRSSRSSSTSTSR